MERWCVGKLISLAGSALTFLPEVVPVQSGQNSSTLLLYYYQADFSTHNLLKDVSAQVALSLMKILPPPMVTPSLFLPMAPLDCNCGIRRQQRGKKAGKRSSVAAVRIQFDLLLCLRFCSTIMAICRSRENVNSGKPRNKKGAQNKG